MIEEGEYQRPIIGVFISQSKIKKLILQENQFASYTRIYELHKASKRSSVTLYFFSIKDWRREAEEIVGTFYDDEEGVWKQGLFPIPDVLYDRGSGSKYKSDVKKLRELYNQKNRLKINSMSFFDKWNVYQVLKKYPETAVYLPETKLYECKEDLVYFFSKFSMTYVKGVRGGRGKRVMRVEKLSNGGYQYSYYVDGLVQGVVETLDDLEIVINQFLNNKPFIVQQGINFIKEHDSNVDFRAEMQRNGKGNIEIVGISARIGHKDSPITIHSCAYKMEEYLYRFMDLSERDVNNLVSRIEAFLYKLYTVVENEFGEFGEMGIDFGIDEMGELWFIEPNAKTAKVSLQKAYSQKEFQRSFDNVVQYAWLLYSESRKYGLTPHI